MISIVNVSTHADLYGINEYELRINRQIIARFEHTRSEGLAACLQKAAAAAEKAKLDEVARYLIQQAG